MTSLNFDQFHIFDMHCPPEYEPVTRGGCGAGSRDERGAMPTYWTLAEREKTALVATARRPVGSSGRDRAALASSSTESAAFLGSG